MLNNIWVSLEYIGVTRYIGLNGFKPWPVFVHGYLQWEPENSGIRRRLSDSSYDFK